MPQVNHMQKELDSLRRASSASFSKLHKSAGPPPEIGGSSAGDTWHHSHEDASWELQVMLRTEKENNKFLADSLAELQVSAFVI
jgi:hypothetical protein